MQFGRCRQAQKEMENGFLFLQVPTPPASSPDARVMLIFDKMGRCIQTLLPARPGLLH
jgi:hypothetical protein